MEPAETRFDILAPPQWVAPIVFNSPHSGSFLPPEFLEATILTPRQLRSSEDSYVDDLFSGCVDAGAPLMRSLVSRAYLDLNREPFELDSRMFRERLPAYVNCSSPRVASGLGTIPRTVGDGVQIYGEPISFSEAVNRIDAVYRPYHRALGALLDEAYQATGQVLLVDCHSMPSSAVAHVRGGVDVVLGDRFGSACSPEISAVIEHRMEQAGLKVSRNKPYSGGFFTENHGRPRQLRHAIQIEVNRSLYMNERTREKNTGFGDLKVTLGKLALDLADWLAQQNRDFAIAAE